MIKKVPSEQLKVGMYVHDLNSGWMDHGFFRTSFMLRRESEIVKIRETGIHEVYIDTLKGLDAPDAPTQEEVQQEIHDRIMARAIRVPPGPSVSLSQREEVGYAQEVQVEANTVVHGMLMDVRLGRTLDVERAEPVVEKITDSIFRNPGTMLSLCRIKERDNYTFQHCVSVCTLLVSFGRALGLDRPAILDAGMGGMLHDIGKMAVPDEVLNKPGRLSDPEIEIMRTHVPRGIEILHRTPGVTPAVMQIAAEHHERFDGTGYALGIHGHQISRLGRMAAIVDVYDAITSNRIYHLAMEPSEALKKLFEWSSNHFDSELVQLFIQTLGIYPVGSLVRLESQRLAVVVEQNPANLLQPLVRLMFDLRSGQALPPKDVDLAAPGNIDQIQVYEDPAPWGIDVFQALL